MPFPRVTAGTPGVKSPARSASWLNAVSEAAQYYTENQRLGGSPRSGDTTPLAGPPKIRNNTGSNLSRGHAVELGDLLVTPINFRKLWFAGEDYTTGPLAIVREPIASTDIGIVQLEGITTVLVDVTDVGHTHATPATDSPVLDSGASGPALLLVTPTSTGEQELPALIGSSDAVETHGVGLITASIDAATYTDSTNTIAGGEAELRTFADTSTAGQRQRLTKRTGYWAGLDAVTVSAGKARACYWFIENGEYWVQPGCSETDFAESTPAITTTASQSAAENQTTVVTMAATGEKNALWSINGGDDSVFFAVDESTGALTFLEAPDYESPADADTSNDYEVTVRVTNSDGEFDDLAMTVTVTDVAE